LERRAHPSQELSSKFYNFESLLVSQQAKAPGRYCAGKTGQFNLGDVFMWREDDWVVFNLGTQKTWGAKAELKAIESSVNTMVQLAAGLKIDKIGIPKIGAGLGGLEWQPIKDILIKIGNSTDIELIVFEEFVQSK